MRAKVLAILLACFALAASVASAARSDGAGGPVSTSSSGGLTAMPSRGRVTMVAAGDIACRPGVRRSRRRCRHGPVSDRVIALDPDVVAPLGDLQYNHASLKEFLGSYDLTWGRFKHLTRPAAGNHEYENTPDRTAAPGYYSYFGSAAGHPARGYYTYAIGRWQAIVLNTAALDHTLEPDSALPNDCHPVSCAAGSKQVRWLRRVLRKLPRDKCVVAYWHHPRHSSNHPFSYDELTAVYDALHDGGVEVALAGHAHAYERLAPMNAKGSVDRAHGVRQFVVGTGGKDRRFFASPTKSLRGSQFRLPNKAGFGVLELELKSDKYKFRFVSERGRTLDKGSARCHGRPRSS